MPRFFVDSSILARGTLSGEDARHIGRSLRMKVGDGLCLCDGHAVEYRCIITEILPDEVRFEVEGEEKSRAEPSVAVTLFQGYPKADKFETILQKSVELGVSRVVPVLTGRCVARPDAKSGQKKRERFQKIVLEAAKQSGRGIVPEVGAFCSFGEAVKQAETLDMLLLFYESGGVTLSGVLNSEGPSIGVFIGPEGGFDPEEVMAAQDAGGQIVSLGPRILRTETAPIAALSVIQYVTGNLS